MLNCPKCGKQCHRDEGDPEVGCFPCDVCDCGWFSGRELQYMNIEKTLENIIECVVAHHEDYPAHGVNCACLDKYIQAARRLLTVKDAQQRVDYVIGTAMENRHYAVASGDAEDF